MSQIVVRVFRYVLQSNRVQSSVPPRIFLCLVDQILQSNDSLSAEDKRIYVYTRCSISLPILV
ncbi:unnamed protein product [Camellia sinensis]